MIVVDHDSKTRASSRAGSMPMRSVLLISAPGVKPKSNKTFCVSVPRVDSTCIEGRTRDQRFTRRLAAANAQPKCSTSTLVTFRRARQAGGSCPRARVQPRGRPREPAGDRFGAYGLRAAHQRRHNGGGQAAPARTRRHADALRCTGRLTWQPPLRGLCCRKASRETQRRRRWGANTPASGSPHTEDWKASYRAPGRHSESRASEDGNRRTGAIKTARI